MTSDLTEQKIREAYAEAVEIQATVCNYTSFEAGYKALLNELELVGENKIEKLYRLPKGVEK